MRYISAISDDANQKMTVVMEDGSKAVLELSYKENQRGWFMTITWGAVVIYNIRLVTGPNLLRKFRNVLTFGICITTTDMLEPINKDDFSTGRAEMYTLSQDDLLTVEDTIKAYVP